MKWREHQIQKDAKMVNQTLRVLSLVMVSFIAILAIWAAGVAYFRYGQMPGAERFYRPFLLMTVTAILAVLSRWRVGRAVAVVLALLQLANLVCYVVPFSAE